MTRPLRVLAIMTAPTIAAGNRTRVEHYAPILRTYGIEMTMSAFFDDAAYRVLYQPGHVPDKALGTLRGVLRRVRDLARLRSFDLVLIYRESAALGPPIFERVLKAFRLPYVFDFDDAIFLTPMHPVNRRWGWLRRSSRVVETTRGAAAVTVSVEYLAEWARRYSSNVVIVADTVDTDRHRPGLAHPPDRPKVIGWVGSSTTAPYLSVIDEPLRRIAARRNDVLVRVIGGTYDHPTMPVDVVRYDLGREPTEICGFHVGVLPLPDDPWTRGKGAFKALLYMASGIPVVASRVGAVPNIVIHGETGFVVDTAEEWEDALTRLLDDPELRADMGRRGRALIEQCYSIPVRAPALAAVLRDVARRRTP